MPDVSPSLVEAAARAIRQGWHSACSDTRIAEAVLEAVGDALRLEGAQAERERLVTRIKAAQPRSSATTLGRSGYNEALADLLSDLEHSETWVFVPFDPPGEGGVHPEASDG